MPKKAVDDALSAASRVGPPELEAERQRVLTLTRQRDEWKRAAKRLEAQLEDAETRAQLRQAISEEQAVVKIRRRRKKSDLHRLTAGAIWSDWHVGERVTRDQTSGLNRFDPKLCEKRVGRLIEGIERLLTIQRAGGHIEDFLLHLGGDMMTGFIHEDLRLTNFLTPTQEVRFAKRLIRGGLDYMLEKFDLRRIDVLCSYGNHGRTNPGKPFKSAAPENSYEVMMYDDLAEHYGGEERIHWHIARGPYVYADLGGYVVRACHGDHFKYAGGIGGLMIPLSKFLHRMDRGRPANLTIMGHWHNQQALPRCIVNGSLIGYGGYASAIGMEYEPPMQSFFLVDLDRRRRVLAEPIFLE